METNLRPQYLFWVKKFWEDVKCLIICPLGIGSFFCFSYLPLAHSIDPCEDGWCPYTKFRSWYVHFGHVMGTRRHIVRHTQRHKGSITCPWGRWHNKTSNLRLGNTKMCLFWVLASRSTKLSFGFYCKTFVQESKQTHQKDFLFRIDKIEFWVLLQNICTREKKILVKNGTQKKYDPVRTLTFRQPPALSVEGRSSGNGARNRSCSSIAAIALRKVNNFSSSGVWVLSMLENTDQMYAL